MDEMVKEFERFKDVTSAFTLADVTIVLGLSLVLSLFSASVYRATHKGTSYSQSFAQTLVMMGMLTALIMLVIGSNIARAFSLVGALSVIRFRNAVKETRDVGYMFLVMAVGMAVGTRFYLLAIAATATILAVLWAMFRLDLFARHVVERLLRVRFPSGVALEPMLAEVFDEHTRESKLIAVEHVGEGLQEAIYTLVLKDKTDPQRFVEAVRKASGDHKVVLVVGQHEVDL